jgi:hypothetical protein
VERVSVREEDEEEEEREREPWCHTQVGLLGLAR